MKVDIGEYKDLDQKTVLLCMKYYKSYIYKWEDQYHQHIIRYEFNTIVT